MLLIGLTVGEWLTHLVAAALSPLGQRQRLAPPGRHAAPHRRRLLPGGSAPPATVRGLRCQADAVAGALNRWARVPVRPLLCVHSRWRGSPRSFQGGRVADPRQLVEVVRSGSSLASEIELAAARLLEVPRPAA